jgi:hypothetical protein
MDWIIGSNVAVKTEAVSGMSLDVGRRCLIKSGLSAIILALWHTEPSQALEKHMSDIKKHGALPAVLTDDDINAVSPALAHYTEGALLNGLWKRPELSPRDRSVVTVAALMARIQTRGSLAGLWRHCDLRAGCQDRVAYAPSWSGSHHHCGNGQGPDGWGTDTGCPHGRCGHHPSHREALAWSGSGLLDVSHCQSGQSEWGCCRLA